MSPFFDALRVKGRRRPRRPRYLVRAAALLALGSAFQGRHAGGVMTTHGRKPPVSPAVLIGVVLIGALALASGPANRPVNGTIWVANRGAHTIRGFHADTGAVVKTIAMAANSQPGDLAYCQGKALCSRGVWHASGDRDRGGRDGRRPHANLSPSGLPPAPRTCQQWRQPCRGGALWDRHGRGRGYARRCAARPMGFRSRGGHAWNRQSLGALLFCSFRW